MFFQANRRKWRVTDSVVTAVAEHRRKEEQIDAMSREIAELRAENERLRSSLGIMAKDSTSHSISTAKEPPPVGIVGSTQVPPIVEHKRDSESPP